MLREKRRVAVNFDLSIELLQKYYDAENPKIAYTEIKHYMENNGFTHRQFSGYLSIHPMDLREIINFFVEMNDCFPWLEKSCKVMDVTEVGLIFDVKKMLVSINDANYPIKDNNQINIEHKEESKEIQLSVEEKTEMIQPKRRGR
jgi:virulence-associated protein VapD